MGWQNNELAFNDMATYYKIRHHNGWCLLPTHQHCCEQGRSPVQTRVDWSVIAVELCHLVARHQAQLATQERLMQALLQIHLPVLAPNARDIANGSETAERRVFP
jgi:hypothetical protein